MSLFRKFFSYFVFSKSFQVIPLELDRLDTKFERDFFTGKYVYDKYMHFIRDFLLVSVLVHWSLFLGVIVVVLFMVLWEVKDGFLDYRRCPSGVPGYVRWFYGDGFSFMDIVAGLVGVVFGVILYGLSCCLGLSGWVHGLVVVVVGGVLYVHCVRVS